VPGLWSIKCLVERITFAEFVSLSCLEFPDGVVCRPPPHGHRTLGLVELQGCLETLCGRRGLNKSVDGLVVSLGGRRRLPNETGSVVDAQVVAPELNSQVNLVGRRRKVVRKRLGLGKKPIEFPRRSNQST
jgi:hypothetical protein